MSAPSGPAPSFCAVACYSALAPEAFTTLDHWVLAVDVGGVFCRRRRQRLGAFDGEARAHVRAGQYGVEARRFSFR